MSIRGLIIPAVAASLLLGACRSDPPPPPAPEPEPAVNTDSIRQAEEAAARERADSIRTAEEAAARARAEAERLVREARATLTAVVLFDYDESTITAAAERDLRAKLPILRNSPNVRLRLEGHADERGSTEYNLALGSRRAETVVEFLAGFGISADVFTTVSLGEERPAVNRSDEEAWAQNRRVEFHITAGQVQGSEDGEDRP